MQATLSKSSTHHREKGGMEGGREEERERRKEGRKRHENRKEILGKMASEGQGRDNNRKKMIKEQYTCMKLQENK